MATTLNTATLPAVRPAAAGGLTLGLLSALAFASSGPVVKPLLEGGWSLGAALLLRMAGAAIVLLPAVVSAVVRDRSFLLHWRLIVGFGFAGVAGCQLFYFAAMQRIPVGVALLIEYTAPILLVGLAWARTRRTPSRVVLLGSAAAITGLVLMVDVTGGSFDLLGTLFALGSAICLASYFVLSARTGDTMPPLAFAGSGLIIGAVIMAILCVTGVLPFAAPAVDVVLAGVSLPWFVPITWVILVATVCGYGLGVIAASRIGARLASFVGLTEALFAVGVAWLLIGEAPAPVQLVGGALILGGVVLVRLDPAGTASPRGEAAIVPVVPAP
ncbi:MULTISPECIES: EamA family transporter [unclassified Microbacterium]|uniref:EamA family transporter n=1 Tax=unclassified Microbacterium TaxID=2609290 RepID=UPI003745C39D